MNNMPNKKDIMNEFMEVLEEFLDYVRGEQIATYGAVNYSTTQINRLANKARFVLTKAKTKQLSTQDYLTDDEISRIAKETIEDISVSEAVMFRMFAREIEKNIRNKII